jgi:predicted O-methyltransferase YrrM
VKSYPYPKSFSEDEKHQFCEFLRNQTTAEWGGNLLYDGSNSHLQQIPEELTELVFYLKNFEKSNNVKLKKFLEIGFHAGYTNTILNKIFNFDEIVGIDTFQEFVDGNSLRANHRFKNLTLICSDSTSKRTISIAKKFAPFDLILIDGNHDYKYVKKDFENYKPFLSKNSFVMFHDIKSKTFPGVSKLWKEVSKSKQFKSKEFICNDFPIKAGIGILQKI